MADRLFKAAALLAGALCATAAGSACAQSSGTGSSTASAYKSGYSFTAGEISNPVSVSNKDANGNHVIVDGVTQTGSDQSIFYARRTGGAGDSYAGAGGIGSATAIANNLQVSVVGDHNTVVVNSSQSNSGNVTAQTVLNGKVNLDANGG